MALAKFGRGTYTNYNTLTHSADEVYFCTDTHQIFVGADEYTKGTKTLAEAPVDGTTAGDQDRLYFCAATNSVYLCTSASSKTWVRIANINDTAGTVTSVEATDGVETADGNAITASGTIKHSVPSGASTYTDALTDVTPAFGSTFAIEGISTDKFGHVTAINSHSVTIPSETPVTVANTTGEAVTLSAGQSFTVVTGVGMSTATGATNHDLMREAVTFTLPSDVNTTYTISSVEEGVITLTGSDSSSSTAQINGWSDLAKKSDITAVFKFKGTVATVADLPSTDVAVGDVYHVTTGAQGSSDEYVCVSDNPVTWEELGPVIDLSAYATTAYVDNKLTWDEF